MGKGVAWRHLAVHHVSLTVTRMMPAFSEAASQQQKPS